MSSVIPVNRLLRVPSKKNVYKKYSDKGQLVSVSHALLGYPVLMAADILLYKANRVPIGKDQEPNLEVAREISRSLNTKYNLDFPIPERFTVIDENLTIPSILGVGKMSKSKPGTSIFLNDSKEGIRKKIFGIPTDSGKGQKLPSKDTGVYALFVMVELFLGKKARKGFEKQYLKDGVQYGEVKKKLAEAVYEMLKPIQKKRKYFDEHPEEVRRILSDGARKAKVVAGKTLAEVKRAMGLSDKSDQHRYHFA